MAEGMTKTAAAQGAKNALICTVGMVIVLLAMTSMVAVVTGKSILESFVVASVGLWVVVFLGFLGVWIVGRQARGPVLLDCCPFPERKRALFAAANMIFVGVTTGAYQLVAAPNRVGLVGSGLIITFSFFSLIMATGRLQVRENGIWIYASLLRWRRIESYRWAEDGTLMLVVQTGILPLLSRGALPIPREHILAVDRLLEEHIGAE